MPSKKSVSQANYNSISIGIEGNIQNNPFASTRNTRPKKEARNAENEQELEVIYNVLPMENDNQSQPLQAKKSDAIVSKLSPSFGLLLSNIKTDPFWWTPIFTVMLCADLIQYWKSDEHYGDTLANVFLGLPIASRIDSQTRYNQNSWMNNFFSDDVTNTLPYWAGVGFIMARPLLTYVLLQISRRSWTKPFEDKDSINKLNAYNPNFVDDGLHWLLPYGGIPYHLMRVEHALNYDENLSEKDQSKILGALLKIANRHSWCSESYARKILLSSYKSNIGNLKKIIDKYSSTLITDQIDNIELSEENKKTLKKLIYTSLFLFNLFSLMNFWEIVSRKSSDTLQLLSDKASCRIEGKDYQEHSLLGHPSCTLCGTWEKVHIAYKESNDVQKCVSSLLAEERPFKTLFEKFSKLFKYKHNDFSSINLSQQNWTGWENSEWDDFLDLLSKNLVKIEILDLSTQTSALLNETMQHKIESLHNFLKKVPTNTLIISEQQLGQDLGGLFFQGLKHIDLPNIIASNINLGDAGAITLNNALPDMLTKTLDISNNQITDLGFPSTWNQTSITDLNVSGNTDLSCISIYPILPLLYNKTLLALDLSQLSLSDTCMPDFGAAIALSNLLILRLAATGLDNPAIFALSPAFFNASLELLDISHNYFPEQVEYLFSQLNKKILKDLNLDDIGLITENMESLSNFTVNSKLRNLNFANNKFDVKGWKLFTNQVKNMTLDNLNVSNNNIDDVDALAENLINPINIILSNNAITSATALILLKTLAELASKKLDLSNNLLDNQFSEDAPAIISTSKFTDLNFKNNNIGSNIISFITQAPDSLKRLDMGISLNAGDGVKIGNALIEKPLSFLGNKDLNEGETWRLLQAKSRNALIDITVSNNQMDEQSTRALCRISGQTGIQFEGLGLTDSSEKITLPFCQTSSATRLQPWFIFKIPSLLLAQPFSLFNEKSNNDPLSTLLTNMLILFVIYHALKGLMKSNIYNNHGLFKTQNDRFINDSKKSSKNSYTQIANP